MWAGPNSPVDPREDVYWPVNRQAEFIMRIVGIRAATGSEASLRTANTIPAMRRADQSAESPERTEASKGALVLARSVSAGKKAGANASRAGDSLVRAVGRLVNRAVDEMLLGDKRVSSAAEGRRLLAANEQTESRADDIQRIIVLAVPVIRALARGARVVKVPWVIVGSTAVAVGVAVRMGVREAQARSERRQAPPRPADA